jgi:PAS domain-containing protein
MAPIQRTVNTIPSHDAVLRRVVDRLTRTRQPQSAEQLADLLRPLFPRVAVFERQLSGEWPHLYVYRDGRYEPERRDRWWEAPDAPCVHVSAETGRLTSVSGGWASLMHADAADLVGRHFLEFVQPDARAAAQALFEVVDEEREVRSEAIVARPDGTSLAIEFRAVRRDGEIDVCYRPLASPEAVEHPGVPMGPGHPLGTRRAE